MGNTYRQGLQKLAQGKRAFREATRRHENRGLRFVAVPI
jgi:hypothetical protein